MNRFTCCLISCAVGLLAFVLGGFAQSKPKVHVKIPIVAAKPEDVSTVEAIVRADYESISGGVGVPRQWGRDLSLFDSHARFVSVGTNPKTGAVESWGTNEQEYVDDVDVQFVKEGFTEHELAHVIHRYGNVATILSSYEGKRMSTGEGVSRGVNIYQLYNDGKRWWILSVVWDEERPGNPIPAELLPKN